MGARGVNKVIILGSLGKDPETRFMPSGGAVANISVATSETWKDKNTGQPQERVEWHKVVFFNRLAEIAGEYLRKGSKIYLEGSLRTRKWQDQQGQDKYVTEIVATEMQMLDSRGEPQGGGQSGSGQSGGFADSNNSALHASGNKAQQNPTYQQAEPQVNKVDNSFDNFDQDIPF